MNTTEKLYAALMKRNTTAEDEMPPEVRKHVPSNGLRLVSANALQSTGDQMVNASTVLPWVFATLGVPPALTGLLVPIRESGSMLPQAFLMPLVVRVQHRKWIYIGGAIIQALAVAAIALTAAIADALAAGVTILVLLGVFSLGRSFTSIASKDLQGRTIPKGERGQINGLATTASGLVAITLGVVIRIVGGEDLSNVQLAWLLALGALMWVGVSLACWGVQEPEPDAESTEQASADPTSQNMFGQMYRLLRDDKPFRKFVVVRSLLLVSSLAPPFVVTLSIHHGADSLTGLGGFIVASGVAALLGGRIFGRFADRSSKRLMNFGAALASGIVIVTVILAAIPDLLTDGLATDLVFVLVYFSLTLVHTGVRVGRKTYVVDMAEDDLRTTYVAVSNTAMGIVLLVVGGISSLLATWHLFAALLFLAGTGLLGVVTGLRLPDVSKH